MSSLYADEDVSRHVVTALRQSHDVEYPSDSGDTGRSDLWHLRRALRDGRVVVTVNHSDFRFLHRVLTSTHVFGATTGTHAGILSVAKRPEPLDWAQAIDKLLSDRDDLDGRLLVWHPDRSAWLEDAWRPEEG